MSAEPVELPGSFDAARPERAAAGVALRSDVSDRVRMVRALRRSEDSERAASWAVRRLIRVVGEWQPDAALDLLLAPGKLRIEQLGAAQPGWTGDVEWALQSVASLRPARGRELAAPPRPAAVAELRPARDSAEPLLPELGDWRGDDDGHDARTITTAYELFREDQRAQRSLVPWPVAYFDDLRELMELLGRLRGASVRFRLAPADPIETELLRASLGQSWTGSDEAMHRYLGRPVRLRVLVGAADGVVPARLAALVKEWAEPLVLEPLTARPAEAWGGGAESVVGHAVPEVLARGLLRLPAAGEEPYPGFATEHPEFRFRALDPVPARLAEGVRLGTAQTATGSRTDVLLGLPDFCRHVFVEGASGAGKTTMELTILQGLHDRGIGFTFLDAHGSGVTAALPLLAGSRSARRQALRVIRYGDPEHVMPLNLFSGDDTQFEQALELFIEMLAQWLDPKGENYLGPRWRRWFTLIAQCARAVWGREASLIHIITIASDFELIRLLVRRALAEAPEAARSLEREYGRLEGKEATELLSWAVSKLNQFIATEPMRAILGTGANAVDVLQAMDAGEGLLVDLAAPTLGAPSARALGSILLLQHLQAMGRRADPSRPHVIVVDEAQLYSFGPLPSLLAEGRKFGIGLVIATQTVQSLPYAFGDAIESNSGSFLSFRSGIRNAERAALRLQDWPLRELLRLPDLHAAAVLSRDGTTTEPFTLRVQRLDRLRRLPAAEAEAEAAELERRSRAALSEPYRGLAAPTAAGLAEQLQPGGRPASRPAQERPRLLDEWLEQRRAQLAGADGAEQ